MRWSSRRRRVRRGMRLRDGTAGGARGPGAADGRKGQATQRREGVADGARAGGGGGRCGGLGNGGLRDGNASEFAWIGGGRSGFGRRGVGGPLAAARPGRRGGALLGSGRPGEPRCDGRTLRHGGGRFGRFRRRGLRPPQAEVVDRGRRRVPVPNRRVAANGLDRGLARPRRSSRGPPGAPARVRRDRPAVGRLGHGGAACAGGALRRRADRRRLVAGAGSCPGQAGPAAGAPAGWGPYFSTSSTSTPPADRGCTKATRRPPDPVSGSGDVNSQPSAAKRFISAVKSSVRYATW